MQRQAPRFSFAVALTILVSTLQAQNIAGKWQGHYEVNDLPPKNGHYTKAEKEKLASTAVARKLRWEMELLGNGKFTRETYYPVHRPSPLGQPYDVITKGRWSQKGNVVTLVVHEQNGGLVPEKMFTKHFRLTDHGERLVEIKQPWESTDYRLLFFKSHEDPKASAPQRGAKK